LRPCRCICCVYVASTCGLKGISKEFPGKVRGPCREMQESEIEGKNEDKLLNSQIFWW
jgi:hypothetical protein